MSNEHPGAWRGPRIPRLKNPCYYLSEAWTYRFFDSKCPKGENPIKSDQREYSVSMELLPENSLYEGWAEGFFSVTHVAEENRIESTPQGDNVFWELLSKDQDD